MPRLSQAATRTLAQTLFKPGLKIDIGFDFFCLKPKDKLKTTLSKRIKQSYRFEITVGTKGRGKQSQGTVTKIQTSHRDTITHNFIFVIRMVSLCLCYLDQSKKRLKNQETKSTNSISTMGSSDSSSSSSSSSSIESDGSDHESTLQSRKTV